MLNKIIIIYKYKSIYNYSNLILRNVYADNVYCDSTNCCAFFISGDSEMDVK